jgi:hypothetical protein
MAHYKADVWLGSNSGFQTIEVNSSSFNGVTEQIVRLYGVKPEQVRNIRQVSNATQSQESSEGIGGIAVAFILLIFIFFPAYTLSFFFGGAGAWLTVKLSGKTFDEIDSSHKKLYSLLIIISVLFGGVGFYIGDQIQKQTDQVEVKQKI